MVKGIIIAVLLSGGVFFLSVGALGLLRLPDVFTRMHAAAKSDTLGAGMILSAMMIYYGLETISLQLAAIIIFIAVSTPVAAHLVARAVYRSEPGLHTPGTPDKKSSEKRIKP